MDVVSSPRTWAGLGASTVRSRLEPPTAWARKRPQLVAAAVVVGAGLIAYHFTLLSLLDYLRLDTPLAYLPLLPLITIWTVWVRVQSYQGTKAPIQDRQVDYLLGVPILAAAILLVTVVPALWSTYYWTERPDTVSLTLFVAGAVILFFGFNWFWRLRGPLLFLLLMWPALYLHLMAGVLNAFTDATNAVLARVVAHFPLGATLGDSAGLLIIHQGGGKSLAISVGTACSGANSVLGFLLIGSALMMGYSGRKRAKIAWLATGVALAFTLNVLRLSSILFLASAGHESFALGSYHAVIGLILFAAAVTVMLVLVPLFRLHRVEPGLARPVAVPPTVPPRRANRAARLKRAAPALTFGLVVALMAVADHNLNVYAAFVDGTGSPTVEAFGVRQTVAGQKIYLQQEYPWAKQYFGANSSFDRYVVTSQQSGGLVWADVVRTDDRGSLDAYNLENCFLFHNYDISTARRVDLGSGVTGLLLNYRDATAGRRWATVSWAWPIRYKGTVYYERVALTMDITGRGINAPDLRPGDGLRAAVLGLWNSLANQHNDAGAERTFRAADANLEHVASTTVAAILRAG